MKKDFRTIIPEATVSDIKHLLSLPLRNPNAIHNSIRRVRKPIFHLPEIHPFLYVFFLNITAAIHPFIGFLNTHPVGKFLSCIASFLKEQD